VLGNQIYIPKSDLTPSLRNRLIRLAAFQNPEFYQAQAMRLSTFDKPRIISCCEDLLNIWGCRVAVSTKCLTYSNRSRSAWPSPISDLAERRLRFSFTASCVPNSSRPLMPYYSMRPAYCQLRRLLAKQWSPLT